MLFADNRNNTDPSLNLALEEHLLRNVRVEEPILLFYINEPAVIIGRNQNTLEEIDPDYVEENDIRVVRRLSGGGAVYHDLSNLNFSFVTPGMEDLHNFARFTEPVVAVLQKLGVPAELRGKSDIFVNDKKISGNAQYSSKNRMFSHGTILYDTDLEQMLKALNPRQVAIESKAVQSIRNFVTNIRDLLPEEMTIYDLKQALLDGIFTGGEAIPHLALTDADWAQVAQIAEERYRTWQWNVGRSPKFNVQKSEKFPAGTIDVRVDVEKGRIKGIKFYGDFAGQEDVSKLEARLLGVQYEKKVLEEAISGLDITVYFGDVLEADFLNLLY